MLVHRAGLFVYEVIVSEKVAHHVLGIAFAKVAKIQKSTYYKWPRKYFSQLTEECQWKYKQKEKQKFSNETNV